MTPERAHRLRQAIANLPGGAGALAAAVVARLQRVEVRGAVPVDFRRKGPAILTALAMIIDHAELGDEVRRDLTRAGVPIVPDLKNETLASRVRAEMLGAIREATAETWDDQVADAWRHAVDVIAGAIFSHSPAAAA